MNLGFVWVHEPRRKVVVQGWRGVKSASGLSGSFSYPYLCYAMYLLHVDLLRFVVQERILIANFPADDFIKPGNLACI